MTHLIYPRWWCWISLFGQKKPKSSKISSWINGQLRKYTFSFSLRVFCFLNISERIDYFKIIIISFSGRGYSKSTFAQTKRTIATKHPIYFSSHVTLIWFHVLIMSRARFRVNPHFIVAWVSLNSLLKVGANSEV